MAGVLGWGWYPTGKIWLPIVVNDAGKLEIAGVEDAEIRQDTPEDLLHVPHGRVAGDGAYLPFLVDGAGRLQIDLRGIFSEGARVYNDAAISIPNNTPTALTFNLERWDTDNIHSTTLNTSRLTCKTAGKYLIMASISFAANAVGRRWIRIRHNDTFDIDYRNFDATAAGDSAIGAGTIYDLAVDDFVEIPVYQNSGAALDVLLVARVSPEFMMQRIG